MKINSKEAKVAIVEAVGQNMAIAELEPLGLSIRTISGLEEKLGLIYLGDLLSLTMVELKSVKNLGDKALREVEIALNNIHLLTDTTKSKHLTTVVPLIDQAKFMKTQPLMNGHKVE